MGFHRRSLAKRISQISVSSSMRTGIGFPGALLDESWRANGIQTNKRNEENLAFAASFVPMLAPGFPRRVTRLVQARRWNSNKV